MTMMSPCFDCPNRKVGCHSKCEDYQMYNDERAKVQKVKAEYNKGFYPSAHAKRSTRSKLMSRK